MTFIDWLASTIGTAAILAALVAAFWKIIMNRVTASVKSRYDKELETHIDSLRHKTELALKDFEAKANERGIKLTTVFTKQAEVVTAVYEYVVNIQSIVELADEVLKYPVPNAHMQLMEMNKKSNETFETYFRSKKIYLPKHTAKRVNLFTKTTHKLISNMNLITSINELSKPNNMDTWLNDLKQEVGQLDKEIPVLLETLEDDLQRILGFPIETTAKE
jgi:hypothetical protein